MTGITDTGFLVAYGNRTDAHHLWAVELAKRITDPLLTCEAVLAETAFHLGDSRLVLEFIDLGLVRLAFNLSEHVVRISDLAKRYQDRKPDLADLCLIRMSELHPKLAVITVDVLDFRAYRRNGREVIPIIHPPRRN